MELVRQDIRKLTITVKPFIAEKIVELLSVEKAEGVLVREVRGFGRQKGNIGEYLAGDMDMTFVPKIKIECYIATDKSDALIDKVKAIACTGRIGDGKVFVINGTAVFSDSQAASAE